MFRRLTRSGGNASEATRTIRTIKAIAIVWIELRGNLDDWDHSKNCKLLYENLLTCRPRAASLLQMNETIIVARIVPNHPRKVLKI